MDAVIPGVVLGGGKCGERGFYGGGHAGGVAARAVVGTGDRDEDEVYVLRRVGDQRADVCIPEERVVDRGADEVVWQEDEAGAAVKELAEQELSARHLAQTEVAGEGVAQGAGLGGLPSAPREAIGASGGFGNICRTVGVCSGALGICNGRVGRPGAGDIFGYTGVSGVRSRLVAAAGGEQEEGQRGMSERIRNHCNLG